MSSKSINDLDIQNMKALLQLLNENTTCGEECQKNKKIKELQEAYLKAENNVMTSKYELEDIEKKYYILKEGEDNYNEYKNVKMNEEANVYIENISSKLNEKIQKIEEKNNLVYQSYTNNINTNELNNEFINKNSSKFNEIKDIHNNILINDRKTYYELQEYYNQIKYYNILIFLYYFIYVIFIIYIVRFKILKNDKNTSNLKHYITLILLFFYPFLINIVVAIFYYLYEIVYMRIPHNVYMNL